MFRAFMCACALSLCAVSAVAVASKDGGAAATAAATKSATTKSAVKVLPGKVKIVDAPKDLGDAAGKAKDAIAAAKAGKWWHLSALVIVCLMFVLKKLKLLSKLGRAKYIVSPVLSIGAALLATFQGGVSLESAIAVFTSSYATSSLEELWNHGILGKSRGSGKVEKVGGGSGASGGDDAGQD